MRGKPPLHPSAQTCRAGGDAGRTAGRGSLGCRVGAGPAERGAGRGWARAPGLPVRCRFTPSPSAVVPARGKLSAREPRTAGEDSALPTPQQSRPLLPQPLPGGGDTCAPPGQPCCSQLPPDPSPPPRPPWTAPSTDLPEESQATSKPPPPPKPTPALSPAPPSLPALGWSSRHPRLTPPGIRPGSQPRPPTTLLSGRRSLGPSQPRAGLLCQTPAQSVRAA